MTAVARAGNLAPYFKSTSQVVSSSLRPLVAVPTSSEKIVAQPLPTTSTVQALHGSLPINGLKVKSGLSGEFVTLKKVQFYQSFTIMKILIT